MWVVPLVPLEDFLALDLVDPEGLMRTENELGSLHIGLSSLLSVSPFCFADTFASQSLFKVALLCELEVSLAP